MSVLRSGFLALSALLSPLAAQASVWNGSATVTIGGADPGWLDVSIPGFDPGSGTVLSATVRLDGVLQASVFAPQGAPAGATFDNSLQFASGSGSVPLGSVVGQQTGPSSIGERLVVGAGGTLAPAYVETAQGGALDVGLSFLALLDPAGGGATAESLSFTGRVAATVIFADPAPATRFGAFLAAAPALVPEPASAAVIGAGLLAVGLWRRRRR